MYHLIVLVLCFLSLVSCDDVERITPDVHYSPGAIPATRCAQIIEEAERLGFKDEFDSIDDEDYEGAGVPSILATFWSDLRDDVVVQSLQGEDGNYNSQDIYVYDRGVVQTESLWALMEEYMPALEHKIKFIREKVWNGEKEDTANPHADWIFLRKYSPAPGSSRNMLKIHHDSNSFTLAVPLNSLQDYEGGGFIIVRVPKPEGDFDYLQVPDIGDERYRSYEWLATVKRGNTTEVLVPEAETGSSIIYNYTVYHGVAPLISGTRYSLVFFFDMDNEFLKLHRDPEDMGDPDRISLVFESDYEGDDLVQLYWVSRYGEMVLEEEGHGLGSQIWGVGSYPGEKFIAKMRDSGAVLLDYVVPDADEDVWIPTSSETVAHQDL